MHFSNNNTNNSANDETLEIGSPEPEENHLEYGDSDDEELEVEEEPSEPSTSTAPPSRPPLRLVPRRRRLSTYESSYGVLDLESDVIGGSARSI